MSAPSTTLSGIVLRHVKPEDVAQILQIQHSCYKKELHERDEVFISLVEAFPEGNYIALYDGQPAGYVFSHPHRKGAIQAWDQGLGELTGEEDCYYIHDLAIHPNVQRKGIAKLLFQKAEEIAVRDEFTSLTLVAVQKSRKFWQQKGFVPIRKFEYGKPGAGHKAYYMEKHFATGLTPRPTPSLEESLTADFAAHQITSNFTGKVALKQN